MWRTWGVVLAAVLVGAATCGGDPYPGPGLSPPGTPLAAGLVVPVGTQLVGPVFLRPTYDAPVEVGRPRVTSDIAVLQIDGDPFAAWDDLAAQAQDIGVSIPGSGVCEWRSTSANPITYSSYPDVPVVASRPDHADAMACEATARGPLSHGSQVMVEMSLWWWAAGAELHVEVAEGDMSESPFYLQETVSGPAPAAASGQLPDRDAQTPVEAGGLLGRQNNCFESRYDQLTVPVGSRLLGGGTTPVLPRYDFAAVLAVEDAEAVLGQLKNQLDDPDRSGGDYALGEERLADGTSVWALYGGVSAGGGSCSMWSSPDGTALLVTTSSE